MEYIDYLRNKVIQSYSEYFKYQNEISNLNLIKEMIDKLNLINNSRNDKIYDFVLTSGNIRRKVSFLTSLDHDNTSFLNSLKKEE